MTVRNMIEQLVKYDMDVQVVDTYGSPIMWMVYARPNKWTNPTNKDVVRLEPKSQMDINEELHATFEHYIDEGISDIDAIDELKERGFTLDDLKSYSEDTYKWAINNRWEE